MKELKEDATAKEIIRNSYLDLKDPEFKSVTMDRIYRYSRRRRIMESVVVNALAFVAIDALIWLVLKLTGLTVSGLVNSSTALLGRYFLRAGQSSHIVGGGGDLTYLFITFCAIAAIFALVEVKLNSWRDGSRGRR